MPFPVPIRQKGTFRNDSACPSGSSIHEVLIKPSFRHLESGDVRRRLIAFPGPPQKRPTIDSSDK
jgi:hypothetical protein